MTMVADNGVQPRRGPALARMEDVKLWSSGVPADSVEALQNDHLANCKASTSVEGEPERLLAFELHDVPRLRLPQRDGTRPVVAKCLPYLQLEQEGSLTRIHRLVSRVSRLPGLHLSLGCNTPIGSISLVQDRHSLEFGREFFSTRELARFHSPPFASVFLAPPVAMRQEAMRKGWAEPHPWAGHHSVSPLAVVLYAPRNKIEELVVLSMILHAHQSLHAEGQGKRLASSASS